MATLLKEAGKNITATYTMKTDNALISYGGSFSGETFTISVVENGLPEPIPNGTISAGGQQLLRLARDVVIQVVTSNGVGTPSINASILPRY